MHELRCLWDGFPWELLLSALWSLGARWHHTVDHNCSMLCQITEVKDMTWISGIWNIIADMSESGFPSEIHKSCRHLAVCLSHPKKDMRGLCAAVQSRAKYARKREEKERIVKSVEEENRKREERGDFLQKTEAENILALKTVLATSV